MQCDEVKSYLLQLDVAMYSNVSIISSVFEIFYSHEVCLYVADHTMETKIFVRTDFCMTSCGYMRYTG